jgi:hypothetical protein
LFGTREIRRKIKKRSVVGDYIMESEKRARKQMT